ncbi:28S ribosomal S24-A, mitochondrial-like [Paramuricea clavata]|nr:28S ribosomal S24-A, mitochondrial-like [Paramuricea clavata]
MAFKSALNLPAIRSTFHREFLNRVCCSCYPSLKTQTTELSLFGVRFAYQPKSKLKRKAAEVPGYRIGVTKAWDSWHTGSLAGSSEASARLMDDIMIRKFIEGVFYELLVSDIVIKRRDNQIIITFYAAGQQDSIKTYFLVGFCERLLSEMFGCIVKLEIISQLVRINTAAT